MIFISNDDMAMIFISNDGNDLTQVGLLMAAYGWATIPDNRGLSLVLQ